jgi:hypothetical protein
MRFRQAAEKVAQPLLAARFSRPPLIQDAFERKNRTAKSGCATKTSFESTFSATCKAGEGIGNRVAVFRRGRLFRWRRAIETAMPEMQKAKLLSSRLLAVPLLSAIAVGTAWDSISRRSAPS